MSENYNRKKAAIRLTDRKEIYCQNHIFKSNFFCFSNGNSFFSVTFQTEDFLAYLTICTSDVLEKTSLPQGLQFPHALILSF